MKHTYQLIEVKIYKESEEIKYKMNKKPLVLEGFAAESVFFSFQFRYVKSLRFFFFVAYKEIKIKRHFFRQLHVSASPNNKICHPQQF